MAGLSEFLDKKFRLTEKGTTVRTEFMAGLTTFMAMAYILMVNSDMFTVIGVPYEAIYIATAISAVVGTLLIGLLANLPLAQASGMGLNAFFVFTVCIGFKLTYANALVLVLIDGVVFVVLTATGLRKKIFEAIPAPVKKAIPAGIGLFIAFIGLQGAGIVVGDSSTLVNLVSFNLTGGANWAGLMPIVVTLIAFVAMAILSKKNVKGAVIISVIGGAVLYYLLGLTVGGFYHKGMISMSNPFKAFKEFGTNSFFKVFIDGFNFSSYLAIEGNNVGSLILVIVTSALAFCLVDMFDTMGTLYGACARGDLIDENGEIPNMNKAMLADAIATCAGAVCGTSTVTTFVESSAGVAEGGRTGLASVFTAIFFFIAMFLSPIAQLIPSCATYAALIFVGVLMMNCVREIEWKDPAVAVPAFVTIAFMPLTYNISYGIAFGIITYVLIALCTGKVKEIKITTYIIMALFIAMFLLSH